MMTTLHHIDDATLLGTRSTICCCRHEGSCSSATCSLERGASHAEIDAHSDELERVRHQLAEHDRRLRASAAQCPG